jgi:hypothetical protein
MPRQSGFSSCYTEVMTCLETYATLRIFSEALHPEVIGQRLQIDGMDMLPRDPASRYRPRRETNYWGWCTRPLVDSTNNVDHIAAVVNLLESKGSVLDELRLEGCDIDICCYWVSSGQGGPSLDVDMMQSLCKLRLSIWWDVYFSDGTDK